MFKNLIKSKKKNSFFLIISNIILISFIIIIYLNFINIKEISNDNKLKNLRKLSSIQTLRMPKIIKNKEPEIFDKSGIIDKTIDHDKLNDYNISKEIGETQIIFKRKPSNDFHTLLQYSYIMDKNPENIFNYAQGDQNISLPEGNILEFSDRLNISSSSYIIQIVIKQILLEMV
jgi:hypothetical protein